MTNNSQTPTQAEIFGLTFLLTQQLARFADAGLAHLELTTRQWLLLALIEKAFPGQRPTLSEAARVYGSSRQNVKQIALQLEARGYLRLIADPADQRAMRLQLTDKIAIFSEPGEVAREQALLGEIFAGFGGEDLAALRAMLRRLLANIAPEETPV
jgi:DNA-binding MarR family transcriptional regulator